MSNAGLAAGVHRPGAAVRMLGMGNRDWEFERHLSRRGLFSVAVLYAIVASSLVVFNLDHGAGSFNLAAVFAAISAYYFWLGIRAHRREKNRSLTVVCDSLLMLSAAVRMRGMEQTAVALIVRILENVAENPQRFRDAIPNGQERTYFAGFDFALGLFLGFQTCSVLNSVKDNCHMIGDDS